MAFVRHECQIIYYRIFALSRVIKAISGILSHKPTKENIQYLQIVDNVHKNVQKSQNLLKQQSKRSKDIIHVSRYVFSDST